MYHIETLKRKNSRHYTPIHNLATIPDVQNYITAHNLTVNPITPYIFTHIKLSDNSIITQTIDFPNNRAITCSPVELKKVLIP